MLKIILILIAFKLAERNKFFKKFVLFNHIGKNNELIGKAQREIKIPNIFNTLNHKKRGGQWELKFSNNKVLYQKWRRGGQREIYVKK